MIFAPGCFSRMSSARSAVTKSPGTNSPVSSMKKQRSASPSKAAPRSAFLLEHLADHELAVLGQQRIRLVVREAPVGLEEVADGVDREPLEHGRQHRARHPVRRVDHDPERLHRARVDEGQDLLDVARKDIFLPDLSRGLSPGHVGTGQGAVADLQQARVAADRQRAAADDLHARVLLRVVRGGDLDPAVQVEVADGEIEHLGADEADVDHLGACVGGALRSQPSPSKARRAACRARRRSSSARTARRRRARSRSRRPRRARSDRCHARRRP